MATPFWPETQEPLPKGAEAKTRYLAELAHAVPWSDALVGHQLLFTREGLERLAYGMGRFFHENWVQ